MTSTSRSRRSLPRCTLAAALIAAGLALTGCGSMIGEHMPTALGGEPEGAPKRPASTGAYPAVHDMPPPRPTTVLSDADEKKLEDDLVAARNRAAEAAKAAADADTP